MNIKDLKEIIKDLPDEMMVANLIYGGFCLPSCNGKSGIRIMPSAITDRPAEAFVIAPCDGACKMSNTPFAPICQN